MPNAKLVLWNQAHEEKILQYFDMDYEKIGFLYKIKGYQDHNWLIDLNKIFSTTPKFAPVDRSGTVRHPWKYHVSRPWIKNKKLCSQDQAFQQRVKEISSTDKKINIMWSGGIDSTAMLVAFLMNSMDYHQLRVIMSPWSTYENPEFWQLLQKIDIETVDISGTIYYDFMSKDEKFVFGNGGDELTASIDQSFYDQVGYTGLLKPWKQFFIGKNPDNKFIEFCEKFFANSSQEIKTVLEARWFFYCVCKNSSIGNQSYTWSDDDPVDLDKIVSFYDFEEFESSVYNDINVCMPAAGYENWKKNLKSYIYAFDKNSEYFKNKTKFNSVQMGIYNKKRQILLDKGFLVLLSDGTRYRNPSFPLVSLMELRDTLGNDLNHLINDPDHG